MGDPLDYLTVQGASHADDLQAQLGQTLTHHATDDISQSYVSKEVSQAMSYSVTSDELRNAQFRTQVTTITHAPSGAQDSHTLQTLPTNIRAQRPQEEEDPVEWKEPQPPPQELHYSPGPASSRPSGHDQPDLDKFEFPMEEVQAATPPTLLPPIPRPRKPIPKPLTLPEQEQPSPRGSDQGGSQRSSPSRTPPLYQNPMTSRKPPKAMTRLKTRLQDPPPMTPAVSELVARRRYSHLNNTPEDQPLMTSSGMPTSRKASIAGNLSRVASFAAATPGKIKSMATLFFSPRGLGTPSGAPLPIEEEVRLLQSMQCCSHLYTAYQLHCQLPQTLGRNSHSTLTFVSLRVQIDPLDDESIPRYKQWKKSTNKWIHLFQWISLITVCVLLACSVRVESMRHVYWFNLVLWQWLTLALVVACGRLISGWAVKVTPIMQNLGLKTVNLCQKIERVYDIHSAPFKNMLQILFRPLSVHSGKLVFPASVPAIYCPWGPTSYECAIPSVDA